MTIFAKKSSAAVFCIILLFCSIVYCAYAEEAPARQMERDVYRKIVETSLMQEKVLYYYMVRYGVDSVETLKPAESLASMYAEVGNLNESQRLYEYAIKIRKAKMSPSPDNTKYIGIDYYMLGELNLLRNRYWLAGSNYGESVKLATDSSQRIEALNRMGLVHEKLGDDQKALTHYLEAVKEYESIKQSGQKASRHIEQRIVETYEAVVKVYERLGEWEKVREYQGLREAMRAADKEKEKAIP